MDFLRNILRKFRIGYIHFIRKNVFILRVRYFKQLFNNKNFTPNYFLGSYNYISDEFKEKLLSIENKENILEEANLILQNKFETLGSGIVDLGEKINWHQDFKSKRIWEKEFYTKINSGQSINKSDIKVPWELSRFHQLIWLGKAFLVSRDEEFAKKIIDLINDWINENPFCYGVNWNCTMEVAIRAVNWLIAIEIIRGTKFHTKEIERKFVNSLFQHGIYIRNNLEYGRRNGNHYLSDLMGLLWLGLFFNKHSFGKRWQKFAINELDKEIKIQIYDDGVDYEKSTSYQRLVFEILYNSYRVSKFSDYNFTENFITRLEKMFNFILSYSDENNNLNVGDNDNGRVTKYSFREDVNDLSGALGIGSLLFNNEKLPANYRACSDTLFLLNKLIEKKENFERKTQTFPDGGFYFLKNEKISIYIDAGDIGMRGWGGHGHNDIFSYELFYNRNKIICDSGTYCYTSEPEIRQKLRSTKSHNTIMINDLEQVEFHNLFRIKEDLSNPKIIEWESDDSKDILIAEHYGYSRIDNSIVHRRKFEFNKLKNIICIYDEIVGNKVQKVESNFHFYHDVEIEKKNGLEYILKNGKDNLILLLEIDQNCEIKLLDHIYSESYGKLQQNKKISIIFNEKLPIKIKTIIKNG